MAREKLLQGFELLSGEIEIVGAEHERIVRPPRSGESRCDLILSYAARDSLSPEIDAARVSGA
jgi:hypothetical protein